MYRNKLQTTGILLMFPDDIQCHIFISYKTFVYSSLQEYREVGFITRQFRIVYLMLWAQVNLLYMSWNQNLI